MKQIWTAIIIALVPAYGYGNGGANPLAALIASSAHSGSVMHLEKIHRGARLISEALAKPAEESRAQLVESCFSRVGEIHDELHALYQQLLPQAGMPDYLETNWNARVMMNRLTTIQILSATIRQALDTSALKINTSQREQMHGIARNIDGMLFAAGIESAE